MKIQKYDDKFEGTKLILLRHGETESNKIQKIQDNNSELSEKGIQQAKAVAKRLKKFNIDVILCSTYKRTKQTAKEILKEVPKKIHYSDAIVERSCKGWIGLTWAEAYSKYPKIYQKRLELKDFKPLHGESYSMVEKRMIPYVNKMINKYKGKTILIISHGTALATLLGYFLGMPYGRRNIIRKNNCSISVLECQKGHFLIRSINDHSHTEGI